MLQLALKICLPYLTRAVYLSAEGLHLERDMAWSELNYNFSVLHFQIVCSLACIFIISILAFWTLSWFRQHDHVARISGNRSGNFCQGYGALAGTSVVERSNEGLDAGSREPNTRNTAAIAALASEFHPDNLHQSLDGRGYAASSPAKLEKLASTIDAIPSPEAPSDADASGSFSMAKFAEGALAPQLALDSGQVARFKAEPWQCGLDKESLSSNQDKLYNMASVDKAQTMDWIAHDGCKQIEAAMCEEVPFASVSPHSQARANIDSDVPIRPSTHNDKQEESGDTAACFDLAAVDSPREACLSPCPPQEDAPRKRRVSLSHWWDEADDRAGTASPANGKADLFEIGSPGSPVALSEAKPRGRVSLSNWWEGANEERMDENKSLSPGDLIAEVPSPTRRHSLLKPRTEMRMCT